MFEVLEKLMLPIIVIMIPLVWTQWQNERLRKKNKDLEQRVKDISIGLQIDLEIFNQIKDIIETMAMTTAVDRFLILTATNGTNDMRFATVVYEHHKNNPKILLSIGATVKYVRFEFDSHYKKMLKDAEIHGKVRYNVAKMEDSDLKRIYTQEKINHSNIYFLKRGKIDDENDRLFYCSCSTHQEQPFSDNDEIIIKTKVSKMKLLFNEIEKNNE